MNGLARRLLSSELKKIKWQRKLSVSAAMKKDDDFIIKSFLPEKIIPDMKILDRLWIEDAGFKNLVSVVSFFFLNYQYFFFGLLKYQRVYESLINN